MKKQEFNQLVYISKRPFWHFLIALPLYCFAVSMLLKTIDLFYLGKVIDALKFVLATFFLLVCAGGLTFTKRVYTNSDLKRVTFNFTLFKIPLSKILFLKMFNMYLFIKITQIEILRYMFGYPQQRKNLFLFI